MGSVHRESYWLYDVVSYDVQKSLAIRSMAAYWCRCRIFIKLSSLNEQAYHVEIFSDTMMWNWIENRILVLNINFKIRLLKDEQHQINYLNCDQTLKRYMIYDMITTLRMWMLWWTSMWLCSTYWRAPLWHGSNYHIYVAILFLCEQIQINQRYLKPLSVSVGIFVIDIFIVSWCFTLDSLESIRMVFLVRTSSFIN